jgi:hypothetical protein
VPLYVYAIMRADDAARAVAAAQKSGSADLHAVSHEGVSALVSPMEEDALRLRRENILGHADVLQAAFEHGPVLPFRFGTALGDEEAVVRELLAPGVERLRARLDALDGRAEMQVKAVYAEEPLLRSILAGDPTLARAVRGTQGLPPAATHFERMRIGEAVAGAVQARQAADQAALLAVLAPLALSHVVSPPHHERSALNAAFLVERAELERFDRAVEEVSHQRGADMEFKLIGPLPPYSFADQDWEARRPAEVNA